MKSKNNGSQPRPEKRGSQQIVSYQLLKLMEPSEIPPGIPVAPKLARGVLGQFPAGVDLRELALFTWPGRYQLLPIDERGQPCWDDVVDLLMTDRDAQQQRSILMDTYEAVLELLPYDRVDLETAVSVARDRGERHAVFSEIQRHLLNVWVERPAQPGGASKQVRAKVREEVAARIVNGMRQLAPLVRLDQKSVLALSKNSVACSWDRIECSLAAGQSEDAIARAMVRAHFGMRFPVARLARLLTHVERMDVLFFLVRHASDEIEGLVGELEQPSGERVADPELAIPVLYVARDTAPRNRSHALIIRMLPRLRSDISTIDSVCCRILEWLATEVSDEVAVAAISKRDDLDDGPAVLACVRANYASTISDIVSLLPEVASVI